MIEVIRLNECSGGDMYGSCASCGAFSKGGKSLIRIKFMLDRQGTSVCLCSKCANVLFNTLKEKGVTE